MSSLATSILAGFKGRRSIYSLSNESPISDERIEEILSEVIKNMPSGFNTQGTRMVVLLKEEHQKLWDIAHEVASATVPAEQFETLYRNRIAGFRAGYGTVSSIEIEKFI
jgi:predicted oxidoreductase (fatty acid repression mutant protein)